MAEGRVLIKKSTLTEIGNAIREKTGKTDLINPDNMPQEIESIESGGSGEDRLKALFDAKKSCYYEFYNTTELTSEQLNNIFQYDDTSNVTNMSLMFSGCSNLTTIPQLDTSNVTSMSLMFNGCSNLTTIPQLDTSKVTNMSSMLSGCSNLTTIPQLDTSKVTNMSAMFSSCSNLTTIPQLDVSNVTNLTDMFYACSKLETILMTGIKAAFSISSSTKFTREALVTIINNLATVTSSKKLTMGSTNLAKLTDEDKAIATNKGWTLA